MLSGFFCIKMNIAPAVQEGGWTMTKTGYFICERADTLAPHRMLGDSGGRLWIFFQNRYRALSCGFSDSRGAVWSPSADLLADISGPFSACADPAGGLHLTARARHPQDIHYLCGAGGKWDSRAVYSARETGATTCFPSVEWSGGRPHLVFAARGYSSGDWSGIHLPLAPGSGPGPGAFAIPSPAGGVQGWIREMGFVADSLHWGGGLAAGGGGVLHLAYSTFWRDGHHLFYSFLAPGGPGWSPPDRLTGTDRCQGYPSVYSSGDRVFLLYRSADGRRRALTVLSGEGGAWQAGLTVPLDPGAEILAQGFLAGEKGPGIYWADRASCRAMPFGGGAPIPLLDPEGGGMGSFCLAPAGDSICMAWTLRGDPGREILFETVERPF